MGVYAAYLTFPSTLYLVLGHAATRSVGVPIEMQWGIYVLYESMSGKEQSPNGFSETVVSTIKTRMPTITHSLQSLHR